MLFKTPHSQAAQSIFFLPMSTKQSLDEPLKEEQILSAIRRSGFPLEIRLLKAFTDAGFDPSIGMRLIPKEGEKSAEVDLMARCGGSLPSGRALLYLTAMIEAKQLGKRMNFVGFKWQRPDAHSMRAMRIRFSGTPTCRVLPRKPDDQGLVQLMLGGADPIAAALDTLNEPAICPHWAYVRETKNEHHIEARKDDDVRESFTKLVRVTTSLEQNNASFLGRNPGSPPTLLMLQVLLPTIILATPHLYLYDALTQTLEQTDSLILQEMHEFEGVVYARYIDVITESALPKFMDRYRRVKDALGAACDRHFAQLRHIAEMQQAVFKQPRRG